MDNQSLLPKVPLALFTSISVIDASTSAQQARVWQSELEGVYNKFFRDPYPRWTWNDTHECDRDILIELEEVIRSSSRPPLDLELVCSFGSPDWREPYLRQLLAKFGEIESKAGAHVGEMPKDQLRYPSIDSYWDILSPGRTDIC